MCVGSCRVFAIGEDTRALRLVSKLPDLRAGYVNRFPSRFALGRQVRARSSSPKEKPTTRVGFLLGRVDKKDATAFCRFILEW